jgi:ribosomal protein uL13
MLLVDGKDAVLGRLATFVAKELLKGNQVRIINAEKILISGRKEAIFKHYDAWMRVQNIANPRKGPRHFRYPEGIVKRTVRGMLPYKKAKGKRAYERLRVYQGVPEELAGKETISVPGASLEELGTRRYIRLGDLSKHLGANP